MGPNCLRLRIGIKMIKKKPHAPFYNIDRKRVPKDWGHEEWIANYEGSYCMKLLHFNEGRHTSFHYHKLKDETFFVVVGKGTMRFIEPEKLSEAELIIARKEYNQVILYRGDSFHIPVGMAHQFVAEMATDIMEASTTHYDSDSIRFTK